MSVQEEATPAAASASSSSGDKKKDRHEVLGNSSVAARYVLRSTGRSKRGFLIGLTTVLVLVAFVSLLQNVIRRSPVIFLKLSEDSVGEFDMVLAAAALDASRPAAWFTTTPNASWTTTPSSNDAVFGNSSSSGGGLFDGLLGSDALGAIFVNSSDIAERLVGSPDVEGVTPRWMMLARVFPRNASFSSSSSSSSFFSGGRLGHEEEASAVLLVFNSTRENELGIGREWTLPKLDATQAYASTALLSRLGESKLGGDDIQIVVDFLGIASSLMSGGSATSDTGGGGSAVSREELLAELIAGAIGIPVEQSLNFSFQLPEAALALINVTQGEIVITIPDGFNTSRAAVEALYDTVRDALANAGIWVPPFNSSFLANFTGINGTIVLNTTQLFPLGGLNISENGTVTGQLGYDISVMFNSTLTAVANALVLGGNYTVAAGIEKPSGKFSSALGNVVILEADQLETIINQAANNVLVPIRDLASTAQGLVGGMIASLEFIIDQVVSTEQLRELLAQLEDTEAQLSELANMTSINATIPVAEYAMTVLVKLADREKTYMLSEDDRTKALTRFSNAISERLGFNASLSYSTPIADALESYSFFRLFIDQLFLFTLIVMLFLGACLVFSLLLSDVEAKTYEYGMLRALGMKQYVLAELLGFQSLLFSIPGIVLGLIIGFVANIPVAIFIGDYVALAPDISLDYVAVVLAVVLGFVMPALSNVIPIQRALSNTLRDALDIYHQVTSEVKVRVMKLETLGLSPVVLSLSLLVVIFGFATYYLIPLSFIFSNFSMFFTIMILILICFLFGLSMVAATLQPFLENALLYVIVVGRGASAIRSLVKKNLAGHSRRNSKTALMLTTGLAFTLFAGAGFKLMGGSLQNFVRMTSGADFAVFTTSVKTALDEDSFRTFLNSEIASGAADSIVSDYAFISFAMSSFDFVRSTQVANLAATPRTTIDIFGIDRNFLNATFTSFYTPTEVVSQFKYNTTSNREPDVVESLYDDEGLQLLPIEKQGIKIPPSILSNTSDGEDPDTVLAYTNYVDVIVSEALRLGGALDTDTPLLLRVRYRVGNSSDISSLRFLAKSRAMVSSMAGFFFSPYQTLAFGSPVLVTMEAFQDMLEEAHNASKSSSVLPDRPPKRMLCIKTRKDTTADQREALSNALNTYISDDLTVVFDTQSLLAASETTIEMMDLFFLVVSLVSVALCFFVLWLSFTANVNENSWEFAVLRSVGLTANRVILLYVYEALSIVISSVLLGTIIGLAVAIVLTVQFNMFTQLPFTFNFPYTLFFPTLGMSIVIAIVGSWLPASIIRRKPISAVLKGI